MTVFGDNRARTAAPLARMSAVAAIFFIAGAILPARVFHIAVPASRAAMLTGDGNEATFLNENDLAMNKMMAEMAIKPTGDINRDFVDMMIPHHRGAIEMAKAMLAHGDNEALRRISQEIAVTQQQEIVAMRLAVGEPAPLSSETKSSSTTDGMSGMHMSRDSMMLKK
jgi:uncharacterized protein (DUF305 family)